jgi:peptidyl-prolyl cis-trans isomerase D
LSFRPVYSRREFYTMTMLARMRRHKGWLKWSLGIVVVTFVYFFVPNTFRNGVGAESTDVIATINGREVTVGAYQRAYQQQVQQLRTSYGGNIDDQMIRQLGIAQRIVQQMVDEEGVLAEADRLGITVSNAELGQRIIRMPAFQENGQFIGDARYQQLLQMQRPPLRPVDFENDLRNSLTAEKLQAAVAGWVRVSDAEVDEEFHRRNEKVKLELAIFTAAQLRAGIQATDAELAGQFAAHAETYKMPEKRRVRFLAVDAEALRPKMVVTQQEIEAKFKENAASYSTPEQVRASHILFKTDGKDEATVKKLAESVLAKVKTGGDFAALAKQYSDDGSKTTGGDVDYFGKGTMVKEFEDAAWAMKPGEISGLVKSQFGFHIIKVTDKKAAQTKTLADVRPQIEEQLRWEKAQAEASKVADQIGKEVTLPADLDKVAQARGLTVGDSGLFSRDEPLAGIGFAPQVAAEAFTATPGKVSGALRTNQGFAFITLVETKPPSVPKLEEVKDKVREDVIRLKAVNVAKGKAAALAQAASRGNFAAAAKAAGVDVKTTDFVARGSAYPEVGVNSLVDNAVFGLKAGATSAPITTDTAVIVATVKERQDVTDAALSAGRDQLRGELLQQRRGDFFAAYMTKAKQKMKVAFNEAAIRTILGG